MRPTLDQRNFPYVLRLANANGCFAIPWLPEERVPEKNVLDEKKKRQEQMPNKYQLLSFVVTSDTGG